MHPNPAFRATSQIDNLGFARERSFGLLSMSVRDAPPLISHVPFLLDPNGDSADLHLVRSNPMARAIRSATPVRLAISGPDSYVSPDWYELSDQVPTWNYVAVHLTGKIAPLPASALPDLLDRLSEHFEQQLLPKPPWSRSKMTPDAFERMLRMIQPFKLHIEDVTGTWKLGQNKPDAARHSAADHIAGFGIGSEPHVIAGLMKSPFSNSSND